MSDFDDIPIRLPSGARAIVRLPRPFTPKDAEHMMRFLAEYIEALPLEPAPRKEGKP